MTTIQTILLIWTLTTMTNAEDKLERIDNNIGYNLIKFENIKLFTDNHYIHYYYDINFLVSKYQQVKLAHEHLKQAIPADNKLYKEHHNLLEILDYNCKKLRTKNLS